jgi:hypothetical protein
MNGFAPCNPNPPPEPRGPTPEPEPAARGLPDPVPERIQRARRTLRRVTDTPITPDTALPADTAALNNIEKVREIAYQLTQRLEQQELDRRLVLQR